MTRIDCEGHDIYQLVKRGFEYFEHKDMIVGFVVVHPRMLKRIVLDMPDDFEFDFIPEAVGRLGTANVSLKAIPENEIRFSDQNKHEQIRLFI
jgi:hypothetical protein